MRAPCLAVLDNGNRLLGATDDRNLINMFDTRLQPIILGPAARSSSDWYRPCKLATSSIVN